MPSKSEENFYTRQGAKLLADAINKHWSNLGFVSVRAEIHRLDDFESAHYGVRSNLFNGMPPTVSNWRQVAA